MEISRIRSQFDKHRCFLTWYTGNGWFASLSFQDVISSLQDRLSLRYIEHFALVLEAGALDQNQRLHLLQDNQPLTHVGKLTAHYIHKCWVSFWPNWQSTCSLRWFTGRTSKGWSVCSVSASFPRTPQTCWGGTPLHLSISIYRWQRSGFNNDLSPLAPLHHR